MADKVNWLPLPDAPGLWWVWQPEGTWPKTGIVCAVEVELINGVMCAWIPYMEDHDAVTENNPGDSWENAQWSGPIERPAAPEKK